MAELISVEALTVQELPAADPVTDNDLLPIGQGPSSLRKATIASVRAALLGGASNAATATAAANAAAERANTAAETAEEASGVLNAALAQVEGVTIAAGNAGAYAQSAGDSTVAKGVAAEQAADAAISAAGTANTAAANANTKANLADTKATLADAAAVNASTKAALADTKATLADTKAALAEAAASSADDAAAAANSAVAALGTVKADAIAAATNANSKATLANNAATAALNAAATVQANEFTFTATAGQTAFTLPVTPAVNVFVYKNGTRLKPSDFTRSGSIVTLGAASTAGDFIAIVVGEAALQATVDHTNVTGLATDLTAAKARANHTGTQAISTVSGLQAALDAKASVNFSHDATYAQGTVGRSLQRSVFVTDPPFNAVGDGATDDAPAFNAALAYLYSIGGGTLHVPTGSYYLGATIKMGANTALVCAQDVTFFKGHAGSFLSNGLGFTTTSDIPAYGGHGNIVIDGGVWEGFAGDEIFDGFTHFAIGYAKGVTVRNAIIKDGIGPGHPVDLSSCDTVVFEDCKFLGFALNTGGVDTSDVIQLDHSTEGSFPYFGLPKFKQNRNVRVRRCEFGPNPDNADPRFGSFYSGVGAHGSVYGQYPENIWIEECVFDGPQWAGVRPWKWKNAHITRNTFRNMVGRGVHVTATGAGGESSKDINRVQQNQGEASINLWITDNTFDTYADAAIFIADITLGSDTSVRNEDVHVSGNTFADGTVNDAVDARDCRRLTVTGNKSRNIYRLFISAGTRCETVVVSGNSGDGFTAPSAAIYFSYTQGFSCFGNVLLNMQSRAVGVSDNCSRGSVRGNDFTDFGLGANIPGVAVFNACADVSVSGNNFYKVASTNTSQDVQVSGTCARCDTIDNGGNTGNAPVINQATGSSIAKLKYAGTPEGVITAPPGSECNDNTNGVKYVKKSGAGNTGWKLVTQAA